VQAQVATTLSLRSSHSGTEELSCGLDKHRLDLLRTGGCTIFFILIYYVFIHGSCTNSEEFSEIIIKNIEKSNRKT
jgi:hypothetical protein